MENDNKKKVIREILVNDAATGLCFWSLALLVFMQFFTLPQSLATVLTLFLIAALVLFVFSAFSAEKIHMRAVDMLLKDKLPGGEEGHWGGDEKG